MDGNAKTLKATSSNITVTKKQDGPQDILDRLQLLEGSFLDAVQEIRRIRTDLAKRLSDSGTLERLIDAGEVAKHLGLDVPYVYALARNNRIPSIRIGDKYVKFAPSRLNKWLNDKSKANAKPE